MMPYLDKICSMVDAMAITRKWCASPGDHAALYCRADRAVWALLGKHRACVDRDNFSGVDSGKAQYVPAIGGSDGGLPLPGLRLWMKKHQTMEQRQVTSTLVNMAVVLSQAEGRGRRFKIVFPQREIRLPDSMGQRKQVAYINALGVPVLTMASFNAELRQSDLKADEIFQQTVEQSKQDFKASRSFRG
eukprot:9478863-Pyramimonas_sp.AAC.2